MPTQLVQKYGFRKRKKKKTQRAATLLCIEVSHGGCSIRFGVEEKERAMQAASSGIGYGLKYQVQGTKPSRILCIDLINYSISYTLLYNRLGAYRMLKQTQITLASSLALSASKKKMRYILAYCSSLIPVEINWVNRSMIGTSDSAFVEWNWTLLRGIVLSPQRDLGPCLLSLWSTDLFNRLL